MLRLLYQWRVVLNEWIISAPIDGRQNAHSKTYELIVLAVAVVYYLVF